MLRKLCGYDPEEPFVKLSTELTNLIKIADKIDRKLEKQRRQNERNKPNRRQAGQIER